MVNVKVNLSIIIFVIVLLCSATESFEQEPTQDVCSHSVKSRIRNSLKDVACKQPYERLIALKSPGPNFVFLPNVAKVKRCDGYCSHKLHACLPSRSSVVKVSVYQLDKSDSNTPPVCLQFYLEQHEECQCDCMTVTPNCTDHQVVDIEHCECSCKNQDRANCLESLEMSGKDSDHYWDESTCTCNCPPSECPIGQAWSKKQCRCKEVQEKEAVKLEMQQV